MKALSNYKEKYHKGILEDWCKWCVKHQRFIPLRDFLNRTLSMTEAPNVFEVLRAILEDQKGL